MNIKVTTSVRSSFISDCSYDIDKEELLIMMHGREYMYHRVPFFMFWMFLNAPSYGRFYNQFIKNNYSWTKR